MKAPDPGGVAADRAATLGVMGGGQLGRMLVMAAQRMGYATAVLDPDPHSPAGLISQHHVRSGYEDPQGLAELSRLSAAITTEFENVPAPALQRLATRARVAPQADAVAIAQDRVLEKQRFAACKVPCAPWTVIETAEQAATPLANLLPGILKTRRMGYDGKGQRRVASIAQLGAAWQELGQQACVLEQLVPLQAECSVLVARGSDGASVHYPAQLNQHRDGILAVTRAWDAVVAPDLARQAADAAHRLADNMNYVGVLCVEFFILPLDSALANELGRLLANEMAPRPHNSAHYTLDACDLSQFELQVRTLAGLPLRTPRQHSPAIMLNLLGDLWFRHGEQPQEPDWPALLCLPGAHLHLYGKTEARRGRKMGHLNLTAASVPEVLSVATQAAALLGLDAP